MGILDRTVKADAAEVAKLMIAIHGPSGLGKSTICGTANGKILFVCAGEENGCLSFSKAAPGQDMIVITSISEIRELLRELRTPGHGYNWVAFDSGTELQNMIIDEVNYRERRTGKSKSSVRRPGPNDFVKTTMEDWGFIIDRTKKMLRAFRNIPDVNVVVTFLSDEVIIGDGDDARVLIRPMLAGKKLPNLIAQFFNLVGYAFKGQVNGQAKYQILFEGTLWKGKKNILTKGLPGLRYREDPDIDYWYRRVVLGCEPRDPEALMIAEPAFGRESEADFQE